MVKCGTQREEGWMDSVLGEFFVCLECVSFGVWGFLLQ